MDYLYGCSSVSSETPGHPCFKLHRRLTDLSSVAGTSASASGHCPSSSQKSRIEAQRLEKQSLSCAEELSVLLRWLALGNSSKERSFVSGTGDSISSPSWAILSARASTTRIVYDEPYRPDCSSASFCKKKLSTGTCPGTLRIYVATISACHALTDRGNTP